MVYQGGDVLWRHIRGFDFNPLRRFSGNALDAVWLLQSATEVLGDDPLRPAASAGTRSTRLFPTLVSSATAQWQHPGVC
jgi:hypothetical protein